MENLGDANPCRMILIILKFLFGRACITWIARQDFVAFSSIMKDSKERDYRFGVCLSPVSLINLTAHSWFLPTKVSIDLQLVIPHWPRSSFVG